MQVGRITFGAREDAEPRQIGAIRSETKGPSAAKLVGDGGAKERCITIGAIMGQMARWVVEQSPHRSARGVDQVNMRLFQKATVDFECYTPDSDPRFRVRYFSSFWEIEAWIKQALDGEPWLERWNTAFRGRHSNTGSDEMVRIDNDSIPHPDYDFIDIDALTRNVARHTWLDAAEYEREAA